MPFYKICIPFDIKISPKYIKYAISLIDNNTINLGYINIAINMMQCYILQILVYNKEPLSSISVYA